MAWKECHSVNYVEKLITIRRIIVCDLGEHVLDEDLGEKHVGITILSYPNHKSQIMTI
jgi:hypothetical protein